ncbi:MAG: SPASM domain-containing protein, partial [Eubacteriales bacterium]
LVNNFRQAHIYNKLKCTGCWAKFHCGGGCHANAESANATIMEPYEIGCQIEKKRLECAIYIQVLRAGNNEI